MNKKEVYLSVVLLAIAFVILLITLYPYRPSSLSVNPPPEIKVPSPTSKPTLSPVVILSPDISLPLKSPQRIIGIIDKTWVFEGSFPLELFDDQNKSLYQGTGSAPDWLEKDSAYTGFTATLNFSTKVKNGYLKFKKDNPSALPQNDASLLIPVIFSKK